MHHCAGFLAARSATARLNDMLYSLVYTSRQNRPFDPADLPSLLQKSRLANSKAGITGMLLYWQGTFVQVLEGERKQVCKLADAISQDRRHGAFFICSRQQIAVRQFAGWSMGFSDLDLPATPGKHDEPGYRPLSRELIEGNPSLVKKLLLQFGHLQDQPVEA